MGITRVITEGGGGLLNAHELYGPCRIRWLARSQARALSAHTPASLVGMTCIGLYSGIMAFEREVTGLGGCVRAIGDFLTVFDLWN
jgi:hypothetical protein